MMDDIVLAYTEWAWAIQPPFHRGWSHGPEWQNKMKQTTDGVSVRDCCWWRHLWDVNAAIWYIIFFWFYVWLPVTSHFLSAPSGRQIHCCYSMYMYSNMGLKDNKNLQNNAFQCIMSSDTSVNTPCTVSVVECLYYLYTILK